MTNKVTFTDPTAKRDSISFGTQKSLLAISMSESGIENFVYMDKEQTNELITYLQGVVDNIN